MLSDEARYHLLKLLAENPNMSQREMADVMGVSLGKVNYCLKALVDKGLVKVGNFRNNPDKRAYVYLLTAQGVAEKARATHGFLARKVAQYEVLKREIIELRREAAVCSSERDLGES